jgi:hypothetical protein
MTHHTGHLSKDGRQYPEDTLKIEHPPKTRCILLLQHTNKHDAEKRQVHNEVNEYTPAESTRPRNDTAASLGVPFCMSLRRGCAPNFLIPRLFAIASQNAYLRGTYINEHPEIKTHTRNNFFLNSLQAAMAMFVNQSITEIAVITLSRPQSANLYLFFTKRQHTAFP